MSYTNKTQPTTISPDKYLKENFKGKEKVQSEAFTLIDLYSKATGSHCMMWNKIFGFGTYFYNDSKRGEHSSIMTGFAISSTGFTLYNMMGWEVYKKDLEKIGTYKISGKSCLAIKSTEAIDLRTLSVLIKKSCVDMKKQYKTKK